MILLCYKHFIFKLKKKSFHVQLTIVKTYNKCMITHVEK